MSNLHSVFTKSVTVSAAVSKMGVVLYQLRIESQWTILPIYLTISRNIDAIKPAVNDSFVFPQDNALVHLAINTVNCCSAKFSTSFFLTYCLITVQSLTLLTTRFRES